ncbi:MAG: metalloregulator ArsR/SmtB family transcription factor [Firmicutes bacterium]|nr:metalloregulator ArsR/SmtB family transcription factor [Bacillota bacterium]
MDSLSYMEKLLKALADANRLRILAAVQDGALCVCQLMGILGLSQSTVSKHLSVLKEAGLLVEEPRGKRSFYSLPAQYPSPFVSAMMSAVLQELRAHPATEEDRRLAEFMRELRIETVEAARNVRKKRRMLRLL